MINDSVEKEIGSLAWPGYSPPGLGFRTPEDRSGSVFSQQEKEEHIQTGLGRFRLPRGGVGDGGVGEREAEREAGLEGSSLSQLSPQCSCIYHNSGGTIFYKAFATRRARRAKPRLEGNKKEKNPRLKAHRGLRKEGGETFFLFFFSFGDTTPAPALVAPCRSPKPRGLTSAKCALKRPILTPLSLSSSPTRTPPSLSAHLLAGWHCYRYTGRIYEVGRGGKGRGRLWRKTKRHLSIPLGNALRHTAPHHPALNPPPVLTTPH